MRRKIGGGQAAWRASPGAVAALVGLAGMLAGVSVCSAAPDDADHPRWLIEPGREAAVVALLGQYWQAAQPPSLAKATIRRTLIEVEADSGRGKGKFVLRHDSETSAPVGELVKGPAAHIDIDIQCPDCSDAGMATLRTVASAVLTQAGTQKAVIWSANPDKGKPAKAKAQPKRTNAKSRLLVVLGGLTLALIGGIAIARVRRRKPAQPAPPAAAPPADAAPAAAPSADAPD